MLIDHEIRTVECYRHPGRAPQRHVAVSDPALLGFTLELRPIWDVQDSANTKSGGPFLFYPRDIIRPAGRRALPKRIADAVSGSASIIAAVP